MRGVSMRDIARRVGVSAVTVSKALSGRSGVSEETRRLIEKTAADMGYVNPRDAQAEEARAMDVGILVPERYFAPDAYYATICGQLVNTLSAAGHFGVLELLTAGMEGAKLAEPFHAGGQTYGGVIFADSHRPFVRALDTGYIANTGSVGNSLGVPRAHALMLEGDERPDTPLMMTVLSVPYDTQAAVDRAMADDELPFRDSYIKEITTGIYAR